MSPGGNVWRPGGTIILGEGRAKAKALRISRRGGSSPDGSGSEGAGAALEELRPTIKNVPSAVAPSLTPSASSWAALLQGTQMGACLRAPFPHHPNMCSGDRKCRISPPSCLVGCHQARMACLGRDRGPIEPALWASRDNSHTENWEHRPACLSRKLPGHYRPFCATPPPALSPLAAQFRG